MKSKRLSVSFPRGVFKDIQKLAKHLGTSESKAVLFLVMKGVEASQGSENPLRTKK